MSNRLQLIDISRSLTNRGGYDEIVGYALMCYTVVCNTSI